jgi:heparan-alpha-glucosaminide N-acetyltransferase
VDFFATQSTLTTTPPEADGHNMNNPASNANRVLSIDVFRGIIIFTMVFVNELAGVADVPQWMRHLPANVDGMTFVDLVFPAFLFIVGMSIPFAIQARTNKGDSALEIFKHIALRSLGLIVIGVFMVNAEAGYDVAAMGISIPLWTLLMFIYVLLIWSNYPKTLSPAIALGAKLIGVAGLVMLWWMYKGPDNTGMTTQWWGILGLIGWAYLIAGSLFLLTRQFAAPMIQFVTLAAVALVLLIVFFVLDKTDLSGVPVLQTLAENNNNHTHAAIVLLGVILSQLFYLPNFAATKFKNYVVFTGAIALLAFASWQASPISKIWATPSWALFSVLSCCVIFGAVYWLVDVKQQRAWTKFFEPSATNPLLVYILPSILIALYGVMGFYPRPDFFSAGVAGIIWSLFFACVIMGIGAGLTRMGLRVKL